LADFVRQNGLKVTHQRFDADVDQLIKVIKDLLSYQNNNTNQDSNKF
jgi:hypothetical protein